MTVRMRCILPGLLLLWIVGEQGFLYLVGNRLSENQDSVFREYIGSLGEPMGDPGLIGAPAYECRWAPIAFVYRFKMCVTYCRPKGDEGCLLLRVQHPAGFLSFIPRDYPDRIAFDGANIMMFDRAGKVIRDLRQRETM